MRRLLALAAALVLASSCYRPIATYDGHMAIAHPTMTPDEVAAPSDVRVRALLEGSAGGPRGGRELAASRAPLGSN